MALVHHIQHYMNAKIFMLKCFRENVPVWKILEWILVTNSNICNCHCYSFYGTYCANVCHSVIDNNWCLHVKTSFTCSKSPHMNTLHLQQDSWKKLLTFRSIIKFNICSIISSTFVLLSSSTFGLLSSSTFNYCIFHCKWNFDFVEVVEIKLEGTNYSC